MRNQTLLIVGLSLSGLACQTLRTIDDALNRRNRPEEPATEHRAPAAPSDKKPSWVKPDATEVSKTAPLESLSWQARLYFGGLKSPSAGYDPDRIVFLVNGVLVGADDKGSPPSVPIPGDDTVTISVLNGGPVSLQNAEIGFGTEGGQYGSLGFWEPAGMEVWYWCRAPINPSDPSASPLALFTTRNAFFLKRKSGPRKAWVRLKSLDRPEIVRNLVLQ
jgi:hypothetical protein